LLYSNFSTSILSSMFIGCRPGRRSSSSESFHRSQVADIGTTAQVLSMSSDRTESGSRAKVITKGRQRFTVINVIHNQR